MTVKPYSDKGIAGLRRAYADKMHHELIEAGGDARHAIETSIKLSFQLNRAQLIEYLARGRESCT